MNAVPLEPVVSRGRTGRWLLVGAVALLALCVLATTLIVLGLLDGAKEGLTFVVDGRPWRLASDGSWDIDGGTVVGAAIASLVLVTVLALVVPLVLLMVVLAVGGSLLAGALAVAGALGAVLLVLALVLSPLWGLALLLWLLLRKPRPPRPVAGAQ